MIVLSMDVFMATLLGYMITVLSWYYLTGGAK